MVTNLFMFGPEAGSLSADLAPVGSTGRQLEVVQKDVLSGGFGSLENTLFAGNLSMEKPSHLHPDPVLGEDLQLRSVIWHKSGADREGEY